VTAPKNGASINITPQGAGYFLFTDEGNLIRAELSPAGYREISRSHLIDPTWPFNGYKFVYAPPAFANRHVIARSEAEVVCASLEKGQRFLTLATGRARSKRNCSRRPAKAADWRPCGIPSRALAARKRRPSPPAGN
jgi:hypothetical protein